jgi:hypothetical protein
VESIVRLRHERDGEFVHTAWRWTARARVPALLRGLIGGEQFAWTDHAIWNDAALSCTWWTEAQGDLVRCSAQDSFGADGIGGTRLCIRGELAVDAARLGALASLQGMVVPMLEQFLVRKMKADVAQTARALTAYLAQCGR